MKVVFASSECVPYASTGGLGDVAAALPRALQEQGLEVVCIVPLYASVRESTEELRPTGAKLEIPLGYEVLETEVWTSSDTGVRTYFVRYDPFFDRPRLYDQQGRDYSDNFARFLCYQKSVVALIDTLLGNVDVVHCNDWQTGLIPYFLKYGIAGVGRMQKEKTVFTIHNLAFQGLFPGEQFGQTNLPLHCYSLDELEFYGQVSSMKGGIVGSSVVTTVSTTYAEEIQTERLGCGLHGILSDLGDRLVGIVNGVDYTTWNPAKDPYIKQNYDLHSLERKEICRQDLFNAVGLTPAPRMPLLGMVSRLAAQKGLELISEILPELISLDLQFVLLGSGETAFEAQCKEWAARWPDHVAVRIGFDPVLAHKIEAGADIFLMPSAFEPCGLNQLYSLRYGTIPVVHETGGLKDTVLNCCGVS